jgi:NADPH2:quinone reductase
MKAVVMNVPGGPEVLQLQEVPDPQIRGERELLVRLKAAGVNPIDTKLRRRGTFYPEEMPAILGCDGAGVVEAVGSGGAAVSGWRRGLLLLWRPGQATGNYAELIVVDERFVAPKPRNP